MRNTTALFTLLTLFLTVACGPKEPQTRTPPRRGAKQRARARAVAALPVYSASPLTPKLETLVRALKAHKKGEQWKMRPLFKKHIPELAKLDREDDEDEEKYGDEHPVPKVGTVEVTEIRKKFLLGALLKFVGKGHIRCDEEHDKESFMLLSIRKDDKGKERIAIYELGERSELKNGKNHTVVFPSISTHLPIFYVDFDTEGEDGRCSKPSMVTQTESKVDLFHWSRKEIRLLTTLTLSSDSHESGNRKTAKSKLTWLKGKAPNTFYLISVDAEVDSNIETSGESDGSNSTCERTSSVSAVDGNGKLSDLKAKQLDALRRREPVVAKLPPDIKYKIYSKSGNLISASACLKTTTIPKPDQP